MFRIALCDDSKEALTLLSGYLEELKDLYPYQLFPFQSGTDLIAAYQQKHFYDLLILDMKMDGLCGIDAAKKIREIDDEIVILIVTSTVEYAVEGYKVNAFRYILKPVDKQEFTDTVKKILNRHKRKMNAMIAVPGQHGTTKLATNHIYYLESDIRTIRLVSAEGIYTFTGKISALEEQLRPHGFVRIHKSFLVNIGHIHNIYRETVTMDNQDVLPVSKHKRKDVNQEFISFMEKQL